MLYSYCNSIAPSFVETGNFARCYLKSLNQMVIKIGFGGQSRYNPSDVLTFKKNSVQPRNEEYFDSPSTSVTVQSASHLDPLHIHLSGPLTVGGCETVNIKATVSGNIINIIIGLIVTK